MVDAPGPLRPRHRSHLDPPTNAENPCPPIIEAQGLTKAFGDVHALAGLDLVAQSGQVIASGSPDELKGLAGRDVIEIRPRHDADLAAMATVLATVAAETPRIDTDTQRRMR